jgi:sugar phosphate isomerase/epimerase
MALVAVPVGALWAVVLGGVAPSGPIRLANPFFAMDTNFRQAEYGTAARQAEVLAELGYAGSDQTGLGGLADRLKCYDAKGVKLYACYVTITLGTGKDPLPPAAVKEAIAALKGRDVKIWLAVRHATFKCSDPEGDEEAAKCIGELARAGEPAGVGVALYPHSGFWLERVEDAVRLAKKVGCKNVGATFNLCHWLNVTGGKDDVKAVLAAAAPNLTMVTINGADAGGKGWGQLIRPLDQGTYDVRQILAALKEIGYAGPVGLQGFGVRGDSRENLARSMAAWRKMTGQTPPSAAAKEQKP